MFNLILKKNSVSIIKSNWVLFFNENVSNSVNSIVLKSHFVVENEKCHWNWRDSFDEGIGKGSIHIEMIVIVGMIESRQTGNGGI